ncbi:50S ribosomal protein L31 [Candidatus Woesebacteria bacterium RIFOXYB1_FULL_38_16]|uniref:50S ribosomal protein L31 n=1 Tax=Candidatus Woesebacteria bacterium RIFOXYB1_FULL_38_16 TaxID=1802538 RepID=A0A1F8CT68_9BACT|nr:MAG: 50S ribosomal protein L31 [Candidatus Woesebacteria bacterium RIFOXYA1_FULL_38_9]OGM78765.1 MAG: 50S ribosomal protein L31 [Candidatus Woesebacteria bacterium RIFOXYB1_FULL_38_16]
MQTKIHPKWYEDAEVKCACGNIFTVGATQPSYEVDVCSACHPFFTGQMKFVDTAGRVDAFRARKERAMKTVLSKAERRKIKRVKKFQEETSRPDTLEELRKVGKKSKKKS